MERTQSIHHIERVMGTVVTIDVFAGGSVPAAEISAWLDRARAILQHADTVFSTWVPGSPMNRLRRGEITLAQAPLEVAEVLSLAKTAREVSGGWFDPWAMPGGVDPTGFVKGWAAQCAADALDMPGVIGAIVNAAGDIAAFGGLGSGERFRFGIVDPCAPRRLACVVEPTGALATSGTYERGQHLINPYSGKPRARVASATVSGPDLGLADALATAVAVAGDEALPLLEALDGYEALIIGFDGMWHTTAHFPLVPR